MRADGTTLLIGTTKGVFLIRGSASRKGWTVSGPYCEGWPINYVIGDAQSGTLWAGGGGDWNGAGVWRWQDGGAAWEAARLTRGTQDDWAAKDPDFAAMTGCSDDPLPFGDAFSQVWSLHYAHGTLYAGAKRARLLASRDSGQSWQEVEPLAGHPSARSWNPRDWETGHCVHNMRRAPGSTGLLYQQNHHGARRPALTHGSAERAHPARPAPANGRIC